MASTASRLVELVRKVLRLKARVSSLFHSCMAGRKADSAEEIAFYHEGPACLEEELLLAHAVGAVFDMTPGPWSQKLLVSRAKDLVPLP